MKKLPIGIQNFKEIIDENHVYVDKTQYIYNLLNNEKHYFLSRPRRFGKSLLLDTIAESFGGEKELFKGLWIYDSDYAFSKYPVVRLDMSNIPNKNPETLEYSLLSELRDLAKKESLYIDSAEPAILFSDLIESLHNKYNQKVAVLIDEYDKPILDHIDDSKIAEENRKVLRGFYGILKSMDRYLRFTFITGVSIFAKTSIFSELNNLKDISMSEEYAEICGIPVNSLELYFGERIAELAKLDRFKKYDSVTEAILAWYDGYSWDGRTRLLNPFSLLSFFSDKRIGSYWYSTGTPKFLVDMIKKRPESTLSLNKLRITEPLLNAFEIERIEIEPLLFQTGYLTVSEVVETMGMPIYVLDIPNNEVRDAFSMHIVAALTESGNMRAGQAQMDICRALESGDLDAMLEMLRGLFASIPYELHIKEEAYYHSIFYAVMIMLGFDIDVEVSTSRGRIDAILELSDKAYIMEFKYEKCPSGVNRDEKAALFDTALTSAIEQINNKGYGDRFKGSGKSIYKTAFAFLGRDEIEMRMETG